MSNNPREACAAEMRALSNWASAWRTHDFPAKVLRRAALVLADDLAAIVAARSQQEVIGFHEQVLTRTSAREATVFRGGRPRTDRYWAAVANGLAADWLELDEGYRKTSCHAGLYVLPALLAEAEADNAPVSDVLRVLAVAYEVVTRIARGWAAPDITMHVHPRYAAIGAAAATSLIRNYDSDDLLRAVSGASTLISPGPRDHAVQGALVRNAWPAIGAWSGMVSADWARCGIGGLAESPHDVFGVVLGGAFRPGAMSDGLGGEWAVLDNFAKIHACCQQTHSAVDAVLALGLDRSESKLANVETIIVETHPLAMPLRNYDPPTTLAAKFSLPHVIATTLVHGHAGAEAFSAESLTAPAVARLRAKVRMVPFSPLPAPPNDRPARITLRLGDGRQVTAECLSARGGPDRPFPEETLIAKIRELCAAAYPGLLPVMTRIAALDASLLDRGWSDAVGEICGTTAATHDKAART